MSTLARTQVSLGTGMALRLVGDEAEANPFQGQRIHFTGIGGSGMCGLAAMLLALGARVSGTDRAASNVTHRLAEAGATVSYEQVGESIPAETQLLVYSSAIKEDHPERVTAAQRGLATVKYAQMLGRVMALKHGVTIAGTHGKSTTTALTAHVLLQAGIDPSFVVGATCPQLGGSSRSGSSDIFVVEACEFDRSFHHLHPNIGVVLNVEEDHLDYYKDLDEIIASFAQYLSQVHPLGLVLVNGSDPNSLKAAAGAKARVETFGIEISADWAADQIQIGRGKARFRLSYRGQVMGPLELSIPGRHNIANATVAAAIAHNAGVPWDKIQAGINSFAGADRRSQLIGMVNDVALVDDYGHHPTEIQATLTALREQYEPQRLICVFQPHQHSRTRLLLEEFSKSFRAADLAIIPDIYYARDSEDDRKAITSTILVEHINAKSSNAQYIGTFSDVVKYLEAYVRPGDLVVSMGAGPVWEVTDELVRRLRR
jgi:UDP-N-acetylmuramate--alanine ligase